MQFDADYVKLYIPEFCNRYNYPQEATDTFLQTYVKIVNDAELKAEFLAPAKLYAERGKLAYKKHLSGNGGVCAKVAEKLGVSTYTADFVYCLTLIPVLEQKYKDAGLDEQIFFDGMDDFRCKLYECKKVYDVWGSFVAGWFGGWFKMTRFAFGRLQYEPIRHIWINCRVGERGEAKVRLFQRFLNMHIPSSGPLNDEDVVKSFKMAYDFFRKRGYAKRIVYHTSSWLLSPDHEKMFDENSNIVKFIRHFKVVKVVDEKNDGDFWRIYNRMYDKENPDFSGETRMQKGYAEILKKGEHIKSGAGVFVYDGEKFYC